MAAHGGRRVQRFQGEASLTFHNIGCLILANQWRMRPKYFRPEGSHDVLTQATCGQHAASVGIGFEGSMYRAKNAHLKSAANNHGVEHTFRQVSRDSLC